MSNERRALEHLDELDEVESKIEAARSWQRRACRYWFVEAPLVASILWTSIDARTLLAALFLMGAARFGLYVAGSMDLDAWRFRRDCVMDQLGDRSFRRGSPST